MRTIFSPAWVCLLAAQTTACGGDDGGSAMNGAAGGGGAANTCYTTDLDVDGYDAEACGGDDCDDGDPGLYPGSPLGLTVEEITRFPRENSADLPELREVAAAVDSGGDVVIAFEGESGVWFGRRSNDAWELETVSPMARASLSGASIAVSGSGDIVIGFRDYDASLPLPVLPSRTLAAGGRIRRATRGSRSSFTRGPCGWPT